MRAGGEAAFGEDGVSVLAAQRGGPPDPRRHAGELERGAHHRNLAEPWVADALDDPALDRLGIVHHLVDGVDRRRGHVGFLQPLEQRIAVELGDGLLDDGLELRPVRHPIPIDGEARIGGHPLEPDGAGELLPEAVIGGGDEHPLAVAALEVAVGRERRMARAEGLGHDAGQQVALRVVGEEPHRRLEQRAVHALTEPGALALQDRGGDAERAEDARREVEERHRRPHGLAVRLAGDGHDPAERLHQRLVAGAVLAGAGAPEGGDGAVDQPRVDFRERLVAEAEALHGAGAEVLDEDVGLTHQCLDHLDALGGLEVEGHAALVAVEEEVGGRLAVLVGRPGARLVAGPRVLHLDDVGAEIAQESPAPGARDDAGQIDDADAVEGQGKCSHAGYYTRGIGLCNRDRSPDAQSCPESPQPSRSFT